MKREDLVKAMQATAAISPVPVNVHGWGQIFVRPQTVAEVDEASQAAEDDAAKNLRFAKAAARVICDEEGNRVFDPSKPEDVDLLANQPWSSLEKVLAAANAKGTDEAGN